MATGLERIAVLVGCESTSDERSAGKPRATIRGSRGRVTVAGHPVVLSNHDSYSDSQRKQTVVKPRNMIPHENRRVGVLEVPRLSLMVEGQRHR